MADIQEILISNKQLSRKYHSLTAVFTGATHGIGLATLRSFMRYIPRPKAILIGRSREKFAPVLDDLGRINPDAEVAFLEAELSLIDEVDRVCEIIKRQTPTQSVHLLCMSQGYAPIGPRRFNREGMDESMTLGVYGCVRMVERLISQGILTPNARVVSVLGGAKEDPAEGVNFDTQPPQLCLNRALLMST